MLCVNRAATPGFKCCGRTCQDWLDIASEHFTIVSPASGGLVLEIDSETQAIQLWRYNGRPNQLWQYDFATHAIVNPATGYALDLDAEDGTKIISWRPNGRPNQAWIIDPRSQTITNPQMRKVIDVSGRSGLVQGASCIGRAPVSAAPGQQWVLRRAGGGGGGGAGGGGRAQALSPQPRPQQQLSPTSTSPAGRLGGGGGGGGGGAGGGGGGGDSPSEGLGLLPPGAGAGASVTMRLRDEDNETVRLVPISEPIDVPNFKGRYHLVLQHPIFFCECARLARKQYKAQPVLFMTRQDWEQISVPGITHEGCAQHEHLIDGRFSSTFLKFVPSLSWQLIILHRKTQSKAPFFLISSFPQGLRSRL